MDPQTNIQFLSGVGPARAELYRRLGISTLHDLLYHFPRAYLDLTKITPLDECADNQVCAVRVRILRKYPQARIRKGLTLFKLTAADDSGTCTVTFFNAKYAFDQLTADSEYIFYGAVKSGPAMASPLVFSVEEAHVLSPIYPLTAGLNSKMISRNVRKAMDLLAESLADPLPADVRQRCRLCDLRYALQNIHFPLDAHAASIARERLIFEELFTLTLALRLMRAQVKVLTNVNIQPFDPAEFYQALPFSPTAAQSRCVLEILTDLYKQAPMNRLLQGDVGSGKTLVAAAACMAAVRSGYQCAVMAPTEILARQHCDTFRAFVSGFGIRVLLLTGAMTAKERRLAYGEAKEGRVQIVVGTHALFSSGLRFENLGLVVTDEQHRFGVAQRVALQSKGACPHVLVMSATPIPRTLALMIYGDLDISVLNELPRGRSPVSTYCISTQKLSRAWSFIRSHLDEGRQAYIVCPLVREEEDALPGLYSAERTAKELCEGEFKSYRVEVLHGKLKSSQKEDIMQRFKDGDIQLLICTTVIEVGVDVPNASVLVCMNAERFGLSQLHQLRGRVGRGSYASSCILVSDARGEVARERLRTMCGTSDGFQIAQADLKLRGPGDFFGGRQHGLPEMRIADLAENVETLRLAQEEALALLERDPLLEKTEHRILKDLCGKIGENVGQRPN